MVRRRVSIRTTSSRTSDQRFALRFPIVVRSTNRLMLRLPARSPIRKAAMTRWVRLGYEAFNRHDFDALLINYAPDVRLYPPSDGVTSGMVDSCYSGHDGFRRLFRNYLDAWGAYRAEPIEFIDVGERVVVLGELRGRGKGSGVPFFQSYAVVMTLNDNYVISHREFFDHAEALEAVGLSE